MSSRKENSTNNLNRRALEDFCGMEYAHGLISGRWKMLILYKLEKGTRRFSELRRLLPNVSERMLTLQLKELERDRLIDRTVTATVPVRVEYALSQMGRELSPVWHALERWGDAHRAQCA